MSPRSRSLAVVIFLVALLVALAVAMAFTLRNPAPLTGTSATAATTRPTDPDPSLTPVEVVAAVLAALNNNDSATDDGLRTTFGFASPGNQAATGPVERFAAIVKKSPYDALINHRAARVKPVDMDDQRATCLVRVVARDGRRVFFLWNLSKQTAVTGPFHDCWMTDGVSPIEPPPGEEQPQERI
jgi:hypothetical protein